MDESDLEEDRGDSDSIDTLDENLFNEDEEKARRKENALKKEVNNVGNVINHAKV